MKALLYPIPGYGSTGRTHKPGWQARRNFSHGGAGLRYNA
jgi:hypothetical protein